MKLVYVVAGIAAMALLVSAAVSATQPSAPPTAGSGPGMGYGMGYGGMGGAAIAISGDSICVVADGMIMKYDTELNLVKKADLPAPAWAGTMGPMGGRRGGGRGRGMMGPGMMEDGMTNDGMMGGDPRQRGMMGGGMMGPGMMGDGPSQAPSKPSKNEAGWQVYVDENCSACHTIDGKGGTVGPDLSKEGSKRKPDWIRAQITDPKVHDPDTVMPVFRLPKEKLDTLVDYLSSLK